MQSLSWLVYKYYYQSREESRWTNIDRMYLGEFGDVPLMTLHYKNGEYVGVGPCRPAASYEFDIVFLTA